MTEDDRRRWDARYEAAGFDGAEAPRVPEAFAGNADLFPKEGNALDVACGRGLGSVWLAARGMTVVGLDVSPVALGQARELANQHGVEDRCRFEEHDLDGGLPDGRGADVILCNMFRGNGLAGVLTERLAPSGLLAIAVLSEVGAEPGRFRALPGELGRAFDHLDVLDAGEGDGRAWLLARSPAANA